MTEPTAGRNVDLEVYLVSFQNVGPTHVVTVDSSIRTSVTRYFVRTEEAESSKL